MDNSAKFWDRISKRYAKRPVADEAAYQKKLEITRQYLQPDMQVLEIGCGTGSTAITHAPFVKHIQALDVSPKMLEIARDKALAANIDNISFTVASVDEFSADDSSLDMVLGLSILHLLDNWQDVVSRVYGMLKPGGLFISSTACIGDSMKFMKFVLPIGNFLGLIPTIKVFTTDELLQALSTPGFQIEQQWLPAKNKAVFIVAKKPG